MTIHPALPALLLLTFAPLALPERWRGGPRSWASPSWTVAWAAIGLAGMALLLPVLRISDGMPSPAALLAEQAPWQGEVAASAGQPIQRDVVYQIQPWLLFARGELRAGRLPLWNPHQFAGSPFWANGQSAPLFPLHLLFAALPLSLGWVVLPWLRFLIAGLGAWALARELGISSRAALLAGLIFPLSGMPVAFLQFPMGNALALVPWVLLAVERATASRGERPASGSRALAVGGLALAVCLQSLGGHPGTVLHTALLSAVYLAVRGAAGWRGWGCWAAGWALGSALAAVQLLPLAFFLLESSRWQSPAPAFQEPLGRLLAQPLRLVLPGLYGDPAAGTWWGPYNFIATSVYAGAGALTLAVAGLFDRGRRAPSRDRRWIAIGVILVVSAAGAYHLPGARQLLQALPVIGRAVPHRLLFGVDLALALLAAAGFEAWLTGRCRQGMARRGLWIGAVSTAVLVVIAFALHLDAWRAHDLVAAQGRWAVGVAATAFVLLIGSARRMRDLARAGALIIPLWFVVDLVLAHTTFMPALSRADFFPRTPAIEHLVERAGEGRIAGTGRTLHPNAATVYGLFDLRGDDTLKLSLYQDVLAERFGSASPVYFEPIARWDVEALDRLGVRWVMTGPREGPPSAGMSLAYSGDEARIYERPSARPLVRWPSAGAGRATVGARRPGHWEIDWSSPTGDTLVVAETAAAGWRGSVDGRTVTVRKVEEILLGIDLPAGSGRLELSYRPPGWWAGVALSGLALAALGILLWRARR